MELLTLLSRGRADRFSSVRELLDGALRLGLPPPEESEPAPDDESARVAGSAQRAAALMIVEAWQSLARDLLMTGAGRADLAAAAQLVGDLQAAAQAVARDQLIAFIALLDRVAEGLRANAAPRLALEMAMLAWPTAQGRPAAG
jgi:hypothetical protein